MANATTAVIVTYNPQAEELEALLASLRPQVSRAVIVDNGSENVQEVRALARKHSSALIPLPNNVGIAAAQNRGILYAMNKGADFVLLSDQDSVAAPDMVEKLLECLRNPPRAGDVAREPNRQSLLPAPPEDVADQFPSTAFDGPIAAVGPVPSDNRGDGSGGDLVYSFTKWGARRTVIPGPGEALAVPFVLASGCLIPVRVLEDVGPMNEDLFIDHVDLAWCLRAIHKGYRILVSGDAHIYHSLGDEVARVPGRKRAVHLHSPARNYYMMRNTLLLQSAEFLPRKWKQRYLWWMLKYMGYYTLAPGRSERIPALIRAVRDGLRGRTGPM